MAECWIGNANKRCALCLQWLMHLHDGRTLHVLCPECDEQAYLEQLNAFRARGGYGPRAAMTRRARARHLLRVLRVQLARKLVPRD